MARGIIHMLDGNKELTIMTDQITGSGGANGPSLMIPIKIDLGSSFGKGKREFSKIDVLSVKGELRSSPGEIRCSESYKLLTRNITGQSIYEEYLNFPLSNEVVNKIEKYRSGKVIFWLDVYIQTGLYREVSFNDGTDRSFMTGTETSFGQLQFEVEQSKWINSILPTIGHGCYKLIELPLANSIIPKEYSNSLVELEEARKYFIGGDYDKAVAHCRTAIDPFKPLKAGEVREFIKSRSELNWANTVIDATEEWLNKMLKATSAFTSKAHHIPSIGHFGRADAEIILMVTTAIVAYIGKVEGKEV